MVTKFWKFDLDIAPNMGQCWVLLECGVKHLCDKLWHDYSLIVLLTTRLAAYCVLAMAMSTCRSSASPPLVITGTSTAEQRCHWSDANELALINFLLNHKAEAGDGGSFKPNIWNAAAVEMLKHTAKGGTKVAGKCKAKYISVCTMFYYFE